MEKKTGWDDIPSLEGLGVEWEYAPENPLGKRKFVRINAEDITGLFEVKEILVKIATAQATHTGRLLDISKGGLMLSLPVLLEDNLAIKVGLFLGTTKVISKAVVKHTSKTGEWYSTGIQFVDLNEETAQYIAGLYASKILHHSPPG
jgi:hypothetical protein